MEDTSYTKLSIENQCIHQSWKARINGYEEAIKLFRQLDERAPEWDKFSEIIKKFVIDSNAIAQEKGLEAALVFVESAAIAGRTAGDMMVGLITKCYGAPKVKTKDIAIKITLMFIEIEKQDVVIEELVKGMDHKFPKIISTCIRAATQAIKEFGSNVLNIKPLLKKLQFILEDRDKTVREEAKLLAIEIYSWIGPIPLKVNLPNLKPSQIQELKVEFEKQCDHKRQPTRFLLSHKKQAAKMEKIEAANGNVMLDKSIEDIYDPEDHIDPINILCQLDNNFYEKLESKKWQERKEGIDKLEGILANSLKLENGDYRDLVRALKTIITKDTNVVIVSIAIKCLTMVANGLKKQFEVHASACIPILLEKFKEKKQIVVLALRNAVDAIYLNITLESIHEDILKALDNKNPTIRAESVSFLARCFKKCTSTDLNKKMLNIFTTKLIKTLTESDPIVRDNSAEALGIAWKVVSEKNIISLLTSVDAIKLAKIKEAADNAVITSKPLSEIKPETKPVSILPSNVEKKVPATNKNAVVKKNHTTINVSRKTIANKSKFKKPTGASDGRKGFPLKGCTTTNFSREIGDDELENLALTFCSPEILNGMIDTNWKTRLLNVQAFSEIVDQMDSAAISGQVLIKLLNKKPGIRDNNVQTQHLRLECLKKIIEKFPISSCYMDCCIQDVASLLGDSKNNNLACQILTALAEVTRLDLISNTVLMYAFTEQKIPKVQVDALNWVSGAILEFGFIIEPKSLIQHIKKAVSASNSLVRMAAISVLGVLYLYMGSQLMLFFENEKPILVQQITAEFEKHQGKVPPKPIRGNKTKGSTENLEMSSDDEPVNKINIQDIVPRKDITPYITDALINEFLDRDWKVRSNALTKFQNIIAEAKFITSDLGGAREALKERISDSNARLSSNTINLLELISIAMGSSFKSYIKLYLPGVLTALGDPKTFKCQSARQCMNTWADVCGYREFFGSDILLEALKNNSVTLRSELWMWLAEKLPLISPRTIPADDLKCLLPVLYSNLEDRNGSVRNNAESAIIGFMKNIGYLTMYQDCEKLKSSMSVKFCREKLDEIRPNLPASPIIENHKVVKSNGHAGSIKSKGPKIISKANTKENGIPQVNTATDKKKEEDENIPLFQHNNLKHQRDIDEHKLKSLKWNFTSPRNEFVEQLKDQMLTAGVNKHVITNMFHSEFKYHLKAISLLSEDLTRVDDNNLALISNLDLILKWLSLRFFDTNPSVLLKGLEYLQRIFDILIVKKYILHDTEASSFVPYLVTKMGDSKDTVRNNVRAILRQIAFIYPNAKLFQYIMDGVKSKNSRQRSECLDHLTNMVDDYGTSICQPSIAVACKEIAKSIGDRDNGVRTAALNFFVAAFFVHGEALLKFVNSIPPKDMGLLKERLKRASKNRIVPVATIQPTMKTVEPPVQDIPDVENAIDDDDDEYISADEEHNEMSIVSQESSHEVSPQKSSNDSNCELETYQSDRTENTDENLVDKGFRSKSEVGHKSPQATRFTLDEKFMVDLEAEVITKPQLVLLPYNWPTEDNKINFGKMTQDQTKLLENMPTTKPCLNVNPYSTKAISKRPINATKSFDPVQQLINQVTSQNIETSNTALTKLDEMLLSSNARSRFLNEGKLSLLFYAIINQIDILFESNGIVTTICYKNVFNLCFNLCKYQEFIGALNEQILCDLLTKLLFILSVTSLENNSSTQQFGRFANSIIMCILERSSRTTIICALLSMLYDTVKYPQNSTASHKELLMKCVWKIVKDFPRWGNELRCEPVLARVHKFLNMFDLTYWKNQQSDVPLKTCKTVLHVMTKLHRDKVLKALENSEFQRDSEMVVYIHKLIKHLNSEYRSVSSR